MKGRILELNLKIFLISSSLFGQFWKSTLAYWRR